MRGSTAGDESSVAKGTAGASSSDDEDHTIYGHNIRAVRCDADDYCPGSHGTAAAPSASVAAGTLSIDDVARFLVGNPSVRTEPAVWTVAGAETNFLAEAGAGEHEQAGELLGQAVVVHFTPVAFDWTYGDGSGQRTTTAGKSWAASGLPSFAKTATSHVYATRGSYTATVTVTFAARYEFAGQGWVDVPGTLSLTSAPIIVTVKSVKTVLVGKNCMQNPTGPGC